MDTDYHIGQRIKELVEITGSDIDTEAKRLGYTRTAIYKIFKRKDVNTELLVHFAKRLGVSVDYFFKEVNQEIKAKVKYPNLYDYQGEVQSIAHELEMKYSKIESLEAQNKLLRDTIEILKQGRV